MQCHNTDVILSARFSNKLEPVLGLLWQYEQYTWRYLRAPRDEGGTLCGLAVIRSVCVHELDDMAQEGSTRPEG